jgi:hypothetical protein
VKLFLTQRRKGAKKGKSLSCEALATTSFLFSSHNFRNFRDFGACDQTGVDKSPRSGRLFRRLRGTRSGGML